MERMREEVPIGPNAYYLYQIPPGPLVPGGLQIRKTKFPLPKLLPRQDLLREVSSGLQMQFLEL
jgi:hypothetical protein